MERIDAAGGQAVGFPERGEAAAVIAEQAVLRACPEETGMVLQHDLDGQVLETLLFPVKLEIVTLRRQRERRCQGSPQREGQEAAELGHGELPP